MPDNVKRYEPKNPTFDRCRLYCAADDVAPLETENAELRAEVERLRWSCNTVWRHDWLQEKERRERLQSQNTSLVALLRYARAAMLEPPGEWHDIKCNEAVVTINALLAEIDGDGA